ncbi:MAG TPA: hypothetical protein VGR02_02920 [Thermoanaerobaculia bacterium]|jgi:hypothetical protein|nr:hypothetical protein [Thermoanaerobaculia bacterium]
MTEKKTWGSTVMGWFIVQDPQQGGGLAADAPSTADASADAEAIRRAAGGGAGGDADAAAQQLGNVFASPPPAAPGGEVDFEQVYQAAGIGQEERERVTRTLELLNSLPAGTDENVRKQIVMASLRAFGVPIEAIIEAGAGELQALEAYIRNGAADTAKLTEEADQRIKQYEEEIVKLRKIMQERVDEQNAVVHRCNSQKLEVQKVLEFFGQEAVARVVRESPRLHEPAAGA